MTTQHAAGLSWADALAGHKPAAATASGPIAVADAGAYAQAALAGEVEAVAGAPEGERNQQLNNSALKLGKLVAGGHLDRAAVEAALTGAARAAGLTPAETAATIRSGLRRGMTEARELVESVPNVAEVSAGTLASAGRPEGPEGAEQGDSGSSWRPVDLAPFAAGILAGTIDRPTPTVGQIDGAGCLFYRGKVNGVAGESGAGKTWTALHATAQEVNAGRRVFYIDHEDDGVGITTRLLDMGLDVAALSGVLYFNPDERPTADDLAFLRAMVTEHRPTLVVVDSTGEGLSLAGANPNADDEVAAWFRIVPGALAGITYDAEAGPAVVVLDHVTKTDEGGLWPIGSQRKRAAISGAQYMQRTVRPFAKGQPGAAALIVAKDRHGAYRTGRRVAELSVTPDGAGVVLTLAPVGDSAGPDARQMPTGYMERVSKALERAGQPLTFNNIVDAVGGKREYVRAALDALVDLGHVATQPGPRRATLHTLRQQYREPLAGESEPRSGSTGSGPLTGRPETSRLSDSRDHSGTTGDHSENGTCAACGGPMADLGDGATTHPSCDPMGGRP